MTKCIRKYQVILMAAAILALFSNKQAMAGSIFESCQSEMRSFCSDVTWGDGRLMACLYAYEDKLSASCDAAIADIADQVDWLFNTMRRYQEICSDDIEKNCTDVSFGGGAVYQCLIENEKNVSAECQKVLPEIKIRVGQ
jgi:hypothetical protein